MILLLLTLFKFSTISWLEALLIIQALAFGQVDILFSACTQKFSNAARFLPRRPCRFSMRNTLQIANRIKEAERFHFLLSLEYWARILSKLIEMYPNLSMGKSTASLIVWLLNSLMTKLHAGATVSHNPTLGSIILKLSDIIKIQDRRLKIEDVQERQRKLSEVTDMIHAAHVFHRCVRDIDSCDKPLHQDNIKSTLVGDYLLAQSSVDMADLRYPRTVGLIAKALEDYTRGEFIKLHLFQNWRKTKIGCVNTIKQYAELTSGSLLSNACLSTALLAGHHSDVADIARSFGFHTGSAHRLIEFLYCPDTNSEADKELVQELDVEQFKGSIHTHIDKSIDLLHVLPDNETRLSLVAMLNDMRSRTTRADRET